MVVNGWNYPCDARFKPWRVLKVKLFDPSLSVPKVNPETSPSGKSVARSSEGSPVFVLPPPAGFGDASGVPGGRNESEEEMPTSPASVIVADDVSYGGLGFLRRGPSSGTLDVIERRDESVSPVNISDSEDLAAVLQCLMEQQDPSDVALPPLRLSSDSSRVMQLAQVGRD